MNSSGKIGKVKNNLVLELHVPDFGRVREFYSRLGFEELSYDPTSGGGSDLGYLVMVRRDELGTSMINFYGDKEKVANHARFKGFPTDTPKGYAVEITFVVSNIQKLWQDIKSQLSEEHVSQKLTLKRWGKRDFRLIDPYGFYIRFTEPVDWGQGKI